MKALVVITGRGLGGDAVNAVNVIDALESRGIDCEIALDKSAPGLLFKKRGYTWHKVKIPQAGGHAATKATALKAAFKMISATFGVRKLIKKLKVDFVVGIIGGGAIIGSVAAKLAGVPAVSLICTPLDSKICSKLNQCYALPELELFKHDVLPERIEKTFFPIDSSVASGDGQKALEKLKEYENFDENKPTILFSSGSSIFKGMIDGIVNFSGQASEKYNLLLVGLPLKDEYLDLLDDDKVIYLGYIDWLKDLFQFVDLAVLTDDGVMLQESVACHLPAVALTRVKYGRYHNMEAIFKGAVIEANLDELNDKIYEAFDNYESLKKSADNYADEVLEAKYLLADKMINEIKK